MAIKTQYVASNGIIFYDIELAKNYEERLEREKNQKKEYYVVLTLECSAYVNALNEQEAIDLVKSDWCAGDWSGNESIVDAHAYEKEEE